MPYQNEIQTAPNAANGIADAGETVSTPSPAEPVAVMLPPAAGCSDEYLAGWCDGQAYLIANHPPATLPEPVDDGLGPYDLKVLRRDDYSGEHREWYESITIPKGHEIVRKIVSEALPVIATQATTIQSLRAEIARKDDTLRDAAGWLDGYDSTLGDYCRAALNPKETNDG